MKKIFRYIILAILALVVAIGAGYGIINKMQQQEIALSERAMLNLEALARGENMPCPENPPGGGNRITGYRLGIETIQGYYFRGNVTLARPGGIAGMSARPTVYKSQNDCVISIISSTCPERCVGHVTYHWQRGVLGTCPHS